jgi:hypothetical protein
VGWYGAKGSADPSSHSATLYLRFSNCCIELVSCLAKNEATQIVTRVKEKMNEDDKHLYTLPDIFRKNDEVDLG